MLNKQYILDYLKTHNQINDKNRVVIENIIDCASEFSPNYLESVQFIRYVIFGRKAQVPDCLFLSERECKVLYALCRIGCVDSVLNPILCKKGQELPEDELDLVRHGADPQIEDDEAPHDAHDLAKLLRLGDVAFLTLLALALGGGFFRSAGVGLLAEHALVPG